MSNVLNTAFFLPFGFRGVVRDAAERSLVQDLLCYDETWIFTDQMSAVGMLAGIMGMDALERALDEGSIRFLHDRFLIGWPDRAGYPVPTPVLSIMSLGHPDGSPGFSQATAADLATHALAGFPISKDRARRLGELAEKATTDYRPIPSGEAVAADTGRASLLLELDRFKQAVLALPNFPVKLADLNRLSRDVRDPRKDWLLIPTKMAIVRAKLASGEALLSPTVPLRPRQLGMVNLALADRFLEALPGVPTPAVVHTEPIVEEILRAHLARLRFAAGSEIEDILRWEEVALPVLIAGDARLDYDRLLRARSSVAARAFRRVVAARDTEESKRLATEYREALANTLDAKIGVQIVRWLLLKGIEAAATIAGVAPLLSDVGGAVGDALIGKLLRRGDARFHIDKELRRVASNTDGIVVVVRK